MAGTFMQRGGGWVVAQFALMAGTLAAGIALPGGLLGPVGRPIGWALIGIGGAVGVAGALHLGRNRTVFPKPGDNSHLVQSGVYAHVRHPLYVSVILLSIGWALLFGSLVALAIATLLAVLLKAKATREEQWLRERYPGYPDYCRRVGRFIPRLRPR